MDNNSEQTLPKSSGAKSKLTANQKIGLLFIATFIIALPISLFASQQKIRTTPKASEPQPTLSLKRVVPTKQPQPTPNKRNWIPKKPSDISVKCTTDNNILNSNETTSCLKPTFKWTSDAASFYVYFGPKPINQISLRQDGKLLKKTTYTPASVNPGQKYNFFVQEAQTDGKALNWLSANNVDPLTWKIPDFVLVTQ